MLNTSGSLHITDPLVPVIRVIHFLLVVKAPRMQLDSCEGLQPDEFTRGGLAKKCRLYTSVRCAIWATLSVALMASSS